MEQSFTLNQCLRLVYNELTPAEGDMLREVIRYNERLGQEFDKIQNAHDLLGRRSVSPRTSSIETIKQYSRKRQLQLSF